MPARILVFGLIVGAGIVVAVGPAVASSDRFDDSILALVGFGVYAAVGGLIVFRRDGHLTGWLLTVVGLAVITASELPFFPGMSEFGAAWIASGAWGVVFALFAALTLTFPSGHPPQGNGIFPRLGRLALWSLPFLVLAGFFTESTLKLSPPTEVLQPSPFSVTSIVPDFFGAAATPVCDHTANKLAATAINRNALIWFSSEGNAVLADSIIAATCR